MMFHRREGRTEVERQGERLRYRGSHEDHIMRWNDCVNTQNKWETNRLHPPLSRMFSGRPQWPLSWEQSGGLNCRFVHCMFPNLVQPSVLAPFHIKREAILCALMRSLAPFLCTSWAPFASDHVYVWKGQDTRVIRLRGSSRGHSRRYPKFFRDLFFFCKKHGDNSPKLLSDRTTGEPNEHKLQPAGLLAEPILPFFAWVRHDTQWRGIISDNHGIWNLHSKRFSGHSTWAFLTSRANNTK